MSRVREKIKKAIEAKGYTVEKMNYSGTDYHFGGWDVWVNEPDGTHREVITGFNYKEILNFVDKFLPMQAQNSL